MGRRLPDRSDRRPRGMHASAKKSPRSYLRWWSYSEVDSAFFCGGLPYTRSLGPTKSVLGRLPDPKLRRWRLPSAPPLPSAATKA